MALQECGDIKVVVRADKSGTTEIFKKALRAIETEFADQFPDPSSKSWSGVDVFLRDKNEGVAATILGTSCTIGYSVLVEAKQLNLNMLRIMKLNGAIVAPNSESVSFSVTEKGLDFGMNGDSVERMTADIQGSLGAFSWPMAGYTYFVLRKNSTRAGRNCETRLQTFKFLEWFYTNSVVKSLAATHGFATLPSEVRLKVFQTFKDGFRCDGQLLAVEEVRLQVRVEVNPALSSVLLLTEQVYDLIDPSLEFTAIASDTPLISASMITNLAAPAIKLGWRHNMVEADGIATSAYAGIGMGVVFDICGAAESCLYSDISVKVSLAVLASILDGTSTNWSDSPAFDSIGTAVTLPNETIIVVRSSQAVDQQWDDRFKNKMQQFESNFVYSKRSIEVPTNEAVLSTVYGMPWSILPFTSVIDSLAGKFVLTLNGTEVSCISDSVMSGAWPFVEHIDMAYPTTFVGDNCIATTDSAFPVGILFARFVYWFSDPSSMLAPTVNNGMSYLAADPIVLNQMRKALTAVTCDSN